MKHSRTSTPSPLAVFGERSDILRVYRPQYRMTARTQRWVPEGCVHKESRSAPTVEVESGSLHKDVGERRRCFQKLLEKPFSSISYLVPRNVKLQGWVVQHAAHPQMKSTPEYALTTVTTCMVNTIRRHWSWALVKRVR